MNILDSVVIPQQVKTSYMKEAFWLWFIVCISDLLSSLQLQRFIGRFLNSMGSIAIDINLRSLSHCNRLSWMFINMWEQHPLFIPIDLIILSGESNKMTLWGSFLLAEQISQSPNKGHKGSLVLKMKQQTWVLVLIILFYPEYNYALNLHS